MPNKKYETEQQIAYSGNAAVKAAKIQATLCILNEIPASRGSWRRTMKNIITGDLAVLRDDYLKDCTREQFTAAVDALSAKAGVDLKGNSA